MKIISSRVYLLAELNTYLIPPISLLFKILLFDKFAAVLNCLESLDYFIVFNVDVVPHAQ